VTSLAGLGSLTRDQILFSSTSANGVTSLWSIRAMARPHPLVAGSDWGDWQSLSPTRPAVAQIGKWSEKVNKEHIE
jgi:hypothetical protein